MLDGAKYERRNVDHRDSSRQCRECLPEQLIVPVDQSQRDTRNRTEEHGNDHRPNHDSRAILEQPVARNNGCENVHGHVRDVKFGIQVYVGPYRRLGSKSPRFCRHRTVPFFV